MSMTDQQWKIAEACFRFSFPEDDPKVMMGSAYNPAANTPVGREQLERLKARLREKGLSYKIIYSKSTRTYQAVIDYQYQAYTKASEGSALSFAVATLYESIEKESKTNG